MMDRKWKNINKKELLLSLYFLVGFFEVLAEYCNNLFFIYCCKPLLVPLLAGYYWIQSKKKNSYLMYSLFFALLANFFFISTDFYSLIIASVFFLIYRGIIIYIVTKSVIITKPLPIFLGCLPFGAVFVYLTLLTYNALGSGIYIYSIQILFLTLLGGYALANYMIEDSKKNFWLLLHAVLFAIIQFLLVLKLFYISINIFQPISIILYIFAQYAIINFVLYNEKEEL